MLLCLLGIGVWFCHTNVLAQDAPGLPGSPEIKGETVIRQSPQIVIIDSKGNWLLPLRGDWSHTTIDDFLDFLQGNRKKPAPPFVIRTVTATGTVAENYVEASVQINFTTFGSQTIQIPLALKEGILKEGILLDDAPTSVPAFRYTGPGTASLSVDSEGQYVALVTPQVSETSEMPESDKPEKPEHTISLLLWIPLLPNDNDEQRLFLSFPQSNSSQFHLEIPMTNIEASV